MAIACGPKPNYGKRGGATLDPRAKIDQTTTLEFDSTFLLLRTYPVPSANLPLPAASRRRRPNENKDRLLVTIPLENVREL